MPSAECRRLLPLPPLVASTPRTLSFFLRSLQKNQYLKLKVKKVNLQTCSCHPASNFNASFPSLTAPKRTSKLTTLSSTYLGTRLPKTSLIAKVVVYRPQLCRTVCLFGGKGKASNDNEGREAVDGWTTGLRHIGKGSNGCVVLEKTRDMEKILLGKMIQKD
ncbi:uncharacterized protein LOC107762467 isoform X2 [Nicotiana tabacum]|uniref:Uncharacterized protein LOC107762467 isoform X2 n=1 Tax=Nicotiana tabacum TaxID=4097 RepID=A0A1S3X8U7_TOBAC|nr:PREDICTED: uncharacterized protein LOC107762467 isoform X2 [Nicotiana tabacum]